MGKKKKSRKGKKSFHKETKTERIERLVDAHQALDEKYDKLKFKYQKLKTAHKDLKKVMKELKKKKAPGVSSTPASKKPVSKKKAQAPAKPQAKKATTQPAQAKPSEHEILARIKKNAAQLDFSRIGKGNARKKEVLTLIKGIGPFLQKRLYAVGIYELAQLSRMTAADAEAVNQVIEYYKGRIVREAWAKQAKELLKE